ncbi:hypothetical protein LJR118_005195 [Acidovorax sp. LjRoot118]|uniref:hypothetical protein n=1 Tax=unclassified Acidovorax TaxID=2684926 RepID=UPI00070D68EA|nr:hypothetical protein [Acidovorax sp. Root217]KRC27916.1 hypothetical protein ASE31_14025 [Acidovorax sp. Root217]
MTPPPLTVIRRTNVLALHRLFLEKEIAAGKPAKGLDQAFAASLEISPSMWSQIKSSRPIGDTLARQIERHARVDVGWLDAEHATQHPDPAEERFLALAREAWRRANAKGKRDMRLWAAERAAPLQQAVAAPGGEPPEAEK